MFSDISPLVYGTLAKMDSLNTTDVEALVEMKHKITVSNGEAVYQGEKMAYSKTMDSEFEQTT